MKIIFLDIDGVLNSQQLAYKNKEAGLSGYGGWFKETDVCEHANVLWGRELVNNLHQIVLATNASIVISSTWRKYFSAGKFKEMFSVYDWKDAPVISETPSLEGIRGKEIEEWLKHTEVESYVILDDSTDFMPSQLEYFVNTDPDTGLSKEDSEKAIQILNNKKHE